MKMAYLSMDMFFNLLDEVKCPEARLVIYQMIDTIRGMRECEADSSNDNEYFSKGVEFAADMFQEALEDYLCSHSKHHDMVEKEPEDPSLN